MGFLVPVPMMVFQSTPVITDGRATMPRVGVVPVDMFQSTPVITDGRARTNGHKGCRIARFNPRPSSLTGEPIQAAGPGCTGATFQSTPVITDGRAQRLCHSRPALQKFQSTPVITDGRAHFWSVVADTALDVSIHARHH